jgi:L-methionine (R)-S-oxide reductase
MNKEIIDSISSELNGSGNFLAKLLNSLSLVKEALGEGAWVGLYVYDEKENVLNLGPFQGSPACESIKPGKGVVGTCYAAKRPMYVPDVALFPGYISCDSKVKSEAVFPIVYQDQVIAVFDVDSMQKDGLKNDLEILSKVASLIGDFQVA